MTAFPALTTFKRLTLFSLAIGLALTSSVTLAQFCPQTAEAGARPKSRLNQLIRNKPNLYMPTRLVIGEDNKFVVRAPAGNKVVIFLSPFNSGMTTPNGKPLRVGKENQLLEGYTSEKGVAVLTVPLPDEKSLSGQPVYIEGYTVGDTEGYSDLEVLELLKPNGHAASNNVVMIQEPNETHGAMVMPGIPGVGSDMLRRLSTMGDVMNSPDRDRMNDLVDDGSIESDTTLDRNTFITRPDGTGGI